MTLLAGSTTFTPGAKDGSGKDAGFFEISGIDFADNGDLLVQDVGVHRVTRSGVVTQELLQAKFSFAGPIVMDSHHRMWMLGRVGVPTSMAIFRFDDNGIGVGQAIHWPGDNMFSAFAVGAHDELFLSHWGRNQIMAVTSDGEMRTVAGGHGRGYRDGPGDQALFNSPAGLWVTATGQLEVCDLGNRALRSVAADGTTTTVARLVDGPPLSDCQLGLDTHFYFTTYANGKTSIFRLERPNKEVFIVDIPRMLSGIVIDASGTIFVAMRHAGSQTPAGVLQISPLKTGR